MSTHRTARGALLPLAAAAALLALSACGDAGELTSAGATPTAVGPTRLWPKLPPATSDPYGLDEGNRASVPGVEVPDSDVHRVKPVAVVQAEVRAHPGEYSGTDGLYDETVRQLGRCDEKPTSCPVLTSYYRDLTGEGSDDLIVGIRMPENQLVVRVYMAEKGRLTRIMSSSDSVISVELAGRDVLIRATSGIPGYEYRTAWSWDDRQRAMFPTHDEFLRVAQDKHNRPDGPGGPRTPDRPGGAGAPPPGPSPASPPESSPASAPESSSASAPEPSASGS
ncbi:hypothetical protein [Streptomyces sp. H27-C3]|uniref:hypothetical protein n=1 Tax=Streptomyces sp. H27-C3 TaxID=3046305 RepID=UPI0024B9AD7E|nr:hypothetical protein [Streptomyces sp. H27-C3]MDJ0462241.1 hypothetical protein [Streptomyces sp. H27-C3]